MLPLSSDFEICSDCVVFFVFVFIVYDVIIVIIG
jgi:hypothetical protein